MSEKTPKAGASSKTGISRRAALARLGVAAGAAYVAPSLFALGPAHASSGSFSAASFSAASFSGPRRSGGGSGGGHGGSASSSGGSHWSASFSGPRRTRGGQRMTLQQWLRRHFNR